MKRERERERENIRTLRWRPADSGESDWPVGSLPLMASTLGRKDSY